MNYTQAVDYIHGLGRFGSKPGLERISLALRQLGDPQLRLNVVHVAGTNGKGSTCSQIASILRAAGLHTGLYTSPYLDSFTNRFGLDGNDIGQDELAAMVTDLRPIADATGLTQFEFITALAFHFYSQKKVDMLVLEVGLGGRFDATNVVRPLLSVITNIGFDHMEVLGDTLPKIAFEKAGIIKHAIPVVTATADPEALQVIVDVATQRQSPIRVWGRDYVTKEKEASLNGQSFDYRGWEEILGLKIKLLGPHQIINAGLAVDSALALARSHGLPITSDHIRCGLSAAEWPGRFEIMQKNPLVIMDGAHNNHGVKALVQTLEQLLPSQKVRLVTGILKDKEPQAMFSALKPYVQRVYACAPDIPRAIDSVSLAAIANEVGIEACSYGEVNKALQAALNESSPHDVVLVAGSLYTVSEARKALAAR